MARCTEVTNLEARHIDRSATGGCAALANARVLCQPCHEKTLANGQLGANPPGFSEAVKKQALANAGNRCQCDSTAGCH
jgi:hypothetical protein